MSGQSRRRSGFWFVWAMPVSLALVNCAGLVSALLGDDIWDGLSWAALAQPVALIVWCYLRRQS